VAEQTLSSWDKSKPIVIFSHNRSTSITPWNFWCVTGGSPGVLRPFSNVTNIHGTPTRCSTTSSQDAFHRMLATSCVAYAPKAFRRSRSAGPQTRRPLDGVGYSRLTMTAANKIENDT